MDTTTSVIRTYYDSWTTGDFGTAISLLADGLIVEVPVNEYPDAESFGDALQGFGSLATRVELHAAMSDADDGMLLYDMDVAGLGTLLQPRPGAGLIRVVAVTPAERHQERLADKIIGCIPAQAPGDVAVNRRRVPVEHHAKSLRNPPRLCDQPAVIRLAPLTPGDSCTTCICMTQSGLREFAIHPVIARSLISSSQPAWLG